MVFGDRPARLLAKEPVPVPSDVLLSAIVGFWFVLQQTPRAVTSEPPSDVISPPDDALVDVTADAVVVVNVGLTAGVVKSISLP